MNYQTFAGVISTGLALGALTFQAGRQSETIESLGVRVAWAENRSQEHDGLLFRIHGKVCAIEKDIKHVVTKVNGKSSNSVQGRSSISG
jgi:hypothetical protein